MVPCSPCLNCIETLDQFEMSADGEEVVVFVVREVVFCSVVSTSRVEVWFDPVSNNIVIGSENHVVDWPSEADMLRISEPERLAWVTR